MVSRVILVREAVEVVSVAGTIAACRHFLAARGRLVAEIGAFRTEGDVEPIMYRANSNTDFQAITVFQDSFAHVRGQFTDSADEIFRFISE